ncbi:transglycosylase SLT domain-containing protein [Streptomyces shenzhenensis]|nr:transglycosylase SLT domain-containing protein [Streptomyces shenzhenensis]
MSDTGSSSGEGAASQAAKERVRRIRRIILIGTAVACAAGAISTSFSPPKTVSAPVAGAQQPDSAAPAPSDPPTGAPGPAPEKPAADDDDEESAPARAGAVPVTDPADAAHAGLPALALEAYQRAADEQAIRTPGCHLPWTLLAAIGQVESHHARNGALTSEGFTTSRILGPVLNGGLFAALPDSDRGTYDGDTTWDRAVGPMQFIPSTWKRWGTTTRPTLDADPNNIFDATTTAAAYLCADNRDLNDPQQLNRAILSYNPSEIYVRDVLAWNAAYASGHSVAALPPMTVPAFDSGESGPVGMPVTGQPSPPAPAGQVVAASLPRDTGPSGSASRPAGGWKGTQPPRSTPASASASAPASSSASAPAPSAGGGASASAGASAGAGAAQPPTAVGQTAPPQQLPPSQSGVPTQSAPPSGTPATSPQPGGTRPPASEPSPGAPHKPAPQSPTLLTRATTQIGGLLHNLGERVLG